MPAPRSMLFGNDGHRAAPRGGDFIVTARPSSANADVKRLTPDVKRRR